MKKLIKELDELAKTDPADIEWPAPPEPPSLRRGDSLGGAYFAGVVERALCIHLKRRIHSLCCTAFGVPQYTPALIATFQ